MHFQKPDEQYTFIVYEPPKSFKPILDKFVVKNCVVLHPLWRNKSSDCVRINNQMWNIEYSEIVEEKNMIYLNKIQRIHYHKTFGDNISVALVKNPSFEYLDTIQLELSKVSRNSNSRSVFFSSLMEKFHLISDHIHSNIKDKILTFGQPFCIKFDNLFLKAVVSSKNVANHSHFMVSEKGKVEIISYENQDVSFANENHIPIKSWNLYDKGVGGMKDIADTLFRRAFVSRMLPPHKIKELGAKHVKGVLLYGPPGTGKTLIARTIANLLNKNIAPKIVSGPEIFNKFVGESQRKVRELFQDAELDQSTYGDKSPLHVIIFDEFDSIGKKRSGNDSAGSRVENDVVNQLLSKMDGLEQLDNLLIIALTNRKDIIDEALLRPGRFEIQIEVKLPTLEERVEIFQIHCRDLLNSGSLSEEVDLFELAERTDNFTGAEIEGIVKSACSLAMSRAVNIGENGEEIEYDSEHPIEVTKEDFEAAFEDITPQFGVQQHKIFNKNFDEIESSDKLALLSVSDFQTLLIHSSNDAQHVEDSVGKFAR